MSRPEPEYTVASLEAEPVAEFTPRTRDDAVRLGEIGIAVIREWNRDVAIEVRVGAELAFRAQSGTTGEENAGQGRHHDRAWCQLPAGAQAP